MNSEAYQINMENRAKELAADVIKKALRQVTEEDLIKNMAKKVAKEALFEIANKGKNRRLHNTKLLMKNYNVLKEHMKGNGENIKVEFKSIDEENPYMKVEFMWLESIARSKARTANLLKYIDDKLDYLEKKFIENKEHEKYKTFEMFFIQEMTSEDIQEIMNCGKNSPKIWCDKVIKELSVLLWGIDALHIE
ncbi:hypothetical protein [Paraclostridium bifermentans]|uniref:hypothetical protein n=1 Tax=Paraclostridium bifermentans TaxID=1490 RepID=UPI0018AB105F|nr:hypothetical protein [Paraclostridium bifermentans]